MKVKSKFEKVAAPGLPPWPTLWFHADLRHAYVTMKLATWRSIERATVACNVTWCLVTVFVWRQIWFYTSARTDNGQAATLTFFGTMIVAGAAKILIHAAFRDFIARQILCARVKVWFRPDAIAFRSGLYAKPVVVWREWQGDPVQCRFEVSPDVDAAAENDQSRSPRLSRHLANAHILRVIIETTNPHKTMAMQPHPVCLREIPMMEVDERDTLRVAIVLSAAASMTSIQRNVPEIPSSSSGGIDIDAQ